MEIINTKKGYALLTIGLRKGYSNQPIPVDEVYAALSRLQERLINEMGIYLSANCFESTIVLSGQREPHLNIRFINYPRFPLEPREFKTTVKELAINLAKEFEQNRIVIEFDDGFMMLQESDTVDPAIVMQGIHTS